MGSRPLRRGSVSGYVVENVRRLRAERRWSLADLSAELTRVGWPILATGLLRLETGKRHVYLDDLYALAAAFGVEPFTLTEPFAEEAWRLAATRAAFDAATEAAQAAAHRLVGERGLSEAKAAELLGVDQVTVKEWLSA